MSTLLLLAAMTCTQIRMGDNSCQQCCVTGTVEVCKHINPCPKSMEEKQIEHQMRMEQQRINLKIEREKTKQLKLKEKSDAQKRRVSRFP